MSGPDGGFAAIIFDCDGVLLDSNALKTDCFRQVLEEAAFDAADTARFLEFQQASFGMSRYRLFEALLGWKLAKPTELDRDALVARYAATLGGRYAKAMATPGMREVVSGLAAEFPLYIVSGSDEAELREVMAQRGDAAFFRRILGSPTNKVDNLALVLAELSAGAPPPAPERVVFIGDAEADLTAARAHGLRFVYMDGFSAAKPRMRQLAAETAAPVIEDLRGLRAALHGFDAPGNAA
jgi:phosphoglycolate phosphatase-like HAD superfamily hydrolase